MGAVTGYSGVENALFYTDNCRMLYGNAQPMAGEIIQHLKAMG
jgi:H+-translocating NAD(P) transhydrogenase subunit beta